MNTQPRHADKKDYSVEYIFKLEILHDPFVSSSVHRHVKLLKNKHPLEVENDDENIRTAIERLNM